jgi:HrpA-like RNA helicase
MSQTNKRPHSNASTDSAKKNRPSPVAVLSSADLPIHQYKEQIVKSVQAHQTTILVGETGTGKSTQLPQFLAEYFGKEGKCVVCTQPRRVAAVTIAQKVASEQGCHVGEKVGYSIRFEDKCSNKTRIKFVTDGVLLRECMGDPKLSKYSVVILDEAHERSLQTDILMGLLRNMQEHREDLRIVVMSATLQTELFSNFFKVLLQLVGFPVTISTYLTAHCSKILHNCIRMMFTPFFLCVCMCITSGLERAVHPGPTVPRQRVLHQGARGGLRGRRHAHLPAGTVTHI